jgi:hypothetical protein
LQATQTIGGGVVVAGGDGGAQGALAQIVERVIGVAAVAPQTGGIGGFEPIQAVVGHAAAAESLLKVGDAGGVAVSIVGIGVVHHASIIALAGQVAGVERLCVDDVVAVGEADDDFTFLLWDYFVKER